MPQKSTNGKLTYWLLGALLTAVFGLTGGWAIDVSARVEKNYARVEDIRERLVRIEEKIDILLRPNP